MCAEAFFLFSFLRWKYSYTVQCNSRTDSSYFISYSKVTWGERGEITSKMTFFIKRGLCVVLCILSASSPVSANPDAKRLYDDLLSNYNRLIRPVSNHTEKVTVKLGLRLSQLVDLVRIVGYMVQL